MTKSELNKLFIKTLDKLEESEFEISNIIIGFDKILPKVNINDI